MKISDSYPTLVQGVSQQSPELRGVGRMTEQVNMMPDPVYGLTRRKGTLFVADVDTGLAASEGITTDTNSFRTLAFNNNSADIDMMIRTAARPTGSGLFPVVAFNRTAGEFLEYTRSVGDTVVNAFEASGASAFVAIGKYVLAAINDSTVPSTTVSYWDSEDNAGKTALWVRGGAFSRTYNVKLTHSTLGALEVSYTTPGAAYAGTLDTSNVPPFVAVGSGTTTENEMVFVRRVDGTPPWGVDTHYWVADLAYGQWAPTITAVKQTIKSGGTTTTSTITNSYASAPGTGKYYHVANDRLIYLSNTDWDAAYAADPTLANIWVVVTYTHDAVDANPNYTRIVTDLTSEYNTAVTQWISTSTAAIQPEAIAAELLALIDAAGVTVTQQGSHLFLEDVTEIVVSDSGDGSLIRGTAHTVSSLDDLTKQHWPGKIVRVQPTNSTESYYLKAVGDGITPTDVRWIEGGAVIHTITGGLVYILCDGTKVYVAGDAATLASLSGVAVDDIPQWVPSTVGDLDSQPLPPFAGQQISYLGVFQDRLLIGSRSTLSLSAVGDYLNFFKSTVVTVPASDAYSMRSEGPDDDVLRYSAVYNRDLVIFGKKRQYLVQGRFALAPTAASMPIMSTHADAAAVPPLDVGGFMFYVTTANDRSHVNQIEPTTNVDSPASFLISSQLDDYLSGSVIEMVSGTKPLTLYCRFTGDRSAIAAFQYLDTPQGRKQDAWFKWAFNPSLGTVVGISHRNNELYLYFLREDAGTLWLVADKADLTGGLSSRPYLDSLREYSSVGAPGHTLATVPAAPWCVAFDNSSRYFLQGRPNATSYAALIAAFPSAPAGSAWVGCSYEAYFIPTNPVMKDNKGVPISSGQLTISLLNMVVKSSSGCNYTVSDNNASEDYSINGQAVGDVVIGTVPVSDGRYALYVYKDAVKYTLRVNATTWLPLTVSAMDWVGQFFNRTARM